MLEVKAGLGGSVTAMTDEQLFSAYRDLIRRAGGDEACSAALRYDGEIALAERGRSAAEFMREPRVG